MEPRFRDQLIAQYRLHIDTIFGNAFPVVSSGAELIALVKNIPVPDFEAGNGWESKPPFPGSSEAPGEMAGAWRMICACRLYDRNDTELVVIYTTFVSGRRTSVFVNAPGTVIPEEYLPVASR